MVRMNERYSIREIKTLLKKLPSAAAAAAELGVSRQFLHEFMKRHDIPYDPASKRRQAMLEQFGERDKAIVSGYRNGKSTLDLSGEFGITRASINRILNKNGVERRIESPCHKRNQKIWQMKEAGRTPSEIADKFGLGRQYVANIIYKMKQNV